MKFQQLIKFIRDCDYKMPGAWFLVLVALAFVLLTLGITDLVRSLGRG
jgi:hypothetical protein